MSQLEMSFLDLRPVKETEQTVPPLLNPPVMCKVQEGPDARECRYVSEEAAEEFGVSWCRSFCLLGEEPELHDTIPCLVGDLNRVSFREPQGMDGFLWASGLTVDMIAPQLEYTGKQQEDNDAIHLSFQKNMSKLMQEISLKKRDEKGMQLIFRDFDIYSSRLAAALRQVGFRGRSERLAQLQLMVNLVKQKYPDEFQSLQRQSKKTQSIMTSFLTKEPFETKVASLKNARFILTSDTSVAEIGSFVTSVNNGDLDTPSFEIRCSELTENFSKALVRFGKWLHGGGALYELKIVIDGDASEEASRQEEDCGNDAAADEDDDDDDGEDESTCASSDNGRQSLRQNRKGDPLPSRASRARPRQGSCQPQFDSVQKVIAFAMKGLAEAEVELFTLKGTSHVLEDRVAGHCKIATEVMRSFASSSKLASLQSLHLDHCWVDADTFAAINEVVSNSSVRSIRLSRLKMGLVPPHKPERIWVETESTTCYKYPAFTDAMQRVERCVNADESEKEVPIVQDMRSLHKQQCRAFKEMVKMLQNVRQEEKHLDVVDFTGTSLIRLFGTVARVNTFLAALACMQPTAVVLKKAELTDANIAGVCELFFRSPHLMHFEMDLACSVTEGVENLQNLVQTSPLLVSGGVSLGPKIEVAVADPVHTRYMSEFGGCCPSPCYPCCVRCCAPPGDNIEVQQDIHHLAFPRESLSLEDFNIYKEVIVNEMQEHLIIPFYSALYNDCKSNEKKLKRLQRASSDPYYSKVLSEEADEPKKELLKKVMVMAKLKAMEEKFWNLEELRAGGDLPEKDVFEEALKFAMDDVPSAPPQEIMT